MLPHTVASHLDFQLKHLGEDPEKAAEILQLCDAYGEEALAQVLSGLLEKLKSSDMSKKGACLKLLIVMLEHLNTRPYFDAVLIRAFEKSLLGSAEFLEGFVRTYCSTVQQQLSVAVALSASSQANLHAFGKVLLTNVIEKVSIDEGFSPVVLHKAFIMLAKLDSPLKDKILLAVSKFDLLHSDWNLFLPYLHNKVHKQIPGATDAMIASANLAGIMEENGYACTASISIFKNIISLIPKIDEQAVAEVLALICTHSSHLDSRTPEGLAALLGNSLSMEDAAHATSWNKEVVIEALRVALPTLNWNKVMYLFDFPKFFLPNEESFKKLALLCKELCKDLFPAEAVCGRVWNNASGQLSFLRYALLCSKDVFSFDSVADVVPVTVEDEFKKAAHSCWLSTKFLDTLYGIAETSRDNYSVVLSILEEAKKSVPELLLVSSVSCKECWRSVNRETVDFILKSYIAGHPNSSVILERVWSANKGTVLRAMLVDYTHDTTSITRALDVCQELKILMPVLKLSPFPFMFDLAALAARREYLNLEKWLGETVQEQGQIFVIACLDFLNDKMDPSDERNSNQIYLSSESAQIFLQFLLRYQKALSEKQEEQLKRIVGHMSSLQIATRGSGGFAADVEEEANANFQNIYSGQQSIQDAVLMLVRLKNSTNERDSEIFRCMLHNLFDEYRFFPKYPEKELRITAQLFGELVQNQLVSSVTLSIALRYILDALSKQPGSKMFTFGKHALEQFMTRLHEWPKFCSHLLMIPNIRQSLPPLVQYLESSNMNQRQMSRSEMSGAGGGSQMLDVGNATENYPSTNVHNILQGSGVPFDAQASLKQTNTTSAAAAAAAAVAAAAAAAIRTNSASQNQSSALLQQSDNDMAFQQETPPSPRFSPAISPAMSPALSPQASGMNPSSLKLDSALQSMPQVHFTLNTETLEAAALKQTFPVPSESIADKIHFLVNNLSSSNIDEKKDYIKANLTAEYYPWFANYMIVKRVAQEPNFHHLYLLLIDKLNNVDINKNMVQTTMQYVKILIMSDRIKTQSSDRSLLKNLGSWLGQMTIARDKPVLHKDIALKHVIIEAYEKGKMIAVIPFIHKVLEPSKKSKVFCLPNPWITAICALLTEIYGLQKLKLNLKFEIEMMFKNLGIQIGEIKASNIVSGRARDMFRNPDFTVDKTMTSAQPTLADPQKAPATQPGLQRPVERDVQRSSGTHSPAPGIGSQSDMTNFVKVVTPACMAIRGVKRIFAGAMDSSVKEVLGPVVERSVTISCMTTRELVLKDFAFEPDEARVRQAARWMVAALASSLALVTCKEPLRANLTNHIWQLLQRAAVPEEVLDQNVNAEVAANLDFCCTIIERHAIDKAIRSLDEALSNSYMMRRKHNELKSTTPFLETTVLQGQLPNLPEALHPSLAGASSHYRVYEEFVKIQRLIINPNDTNVTVAPSQASPQKAATNSAGAASENVNAASEKHGAENVRLLLAEIDKLAAKESAIESYVQLPPDSEIKKAVQNTCNYFDTKLQAKSSAAEQCAKQIFLAVFQGSASKLRIGIYLSLLEHLKAAVNGLDLKITNWFGGITEEVWVQRVDLAETFVRHGLLNLRELDRTLSAIIASRRVGPATDFAIHVVRQCIVLEPLAQAVDMAMTLDVLAKVAAQGRGGGAGDALAQLVEQAKRSSSPQQKSSPTEPKTASLASASSPQNTPAGSSQMPNVSGKDGPQGTQASRDSNALHDQVSYILDKWAKVCDSPNRDKEATGLLVTLQQSGFLKSDETAEQFFTILVGISVSHCVSSGDQQSSALSFDAVDAFVKLVAFLINRSANESENVNPAARGVRRASQLFRVLGVVVQIMQKTSKENATNFNPRPFFRIFVGWYMELLEADVGDEVVMIPSLAAVADALLALQPLRIPAFAFAWLELISHKCFMPKLLLASGQNGWPHFQKLLVALLQFMEPYLRNVKLTESTRLLYKGTLRILLVLLHDFPEFLCKYHFQLCDVIPSSCIQMRNLMLSAFPRNMRLPDPFTPNLKVDLLPEISESPRIVIDFNASLQGLQVPLSTFLSVRQPANFLSELPQKLLLPQGDTKATGTKYNVPLMNAVVLYVGMNAIHKGQAIPMELFQRLVVDLDAEGRYLLLNAIANQLRYPNSHTHYFSCVLLFLFAESSVDIVKEQITRVLLERLIVNRPHPWGLLITFIELIKNPRYQFWSHPFTRCAPEVERLFENVARSCIGPQKHDGEKEVTSSSQI